MTQAERDSLPPPIPKGAGGGEDEKVEVAQDGRLETFPVLLPKNSVVLTHEPMEPAQWPSQHLGNVQVQKMTALTVRTAHVPTAGKFGWEFYIVDGGERIDDQLRKCDTVSMHMAFRVQNTLSSTASALEASARTWYQYYGTNNELQPSWAAVAVGLREAEVPAWVGNHEKAIVKAQLSRSQPVSPDQSAILMQNFARGVVEAKIYVDKHGSFHMSLGVPHDCITDKDDIADVPVVFRYYTETHACAAVCRSFSTSTETITFEEDWDSMNTESWKGMTVGHLWAHLPFIKLHYQVEWHAVQSVEEVLQREKIQFPPLFDR